MPDSTSTFSLKRRRQLIGLAACASALGLLAAACSSSTKSSSSSTSSGQGGTSTATKSTYAIGNVSDVSGTGESVPEIPAVIHAWQSWTNSHGGINGHPVKIISADSHADVAQATTDVKTMVQNDHVLAFVGNYNSAGEAGYASYLQQAHVANLGGADFTPLWTSNPVFLPTAATLLANLASEAVIAQKAGKKNFAILYCSEQAACAETVPMYQAISAPLGMNFVAHIGASHSAPDYTAACLALKNAKADAVFNEGLPPKLFQDCARQGYQPMWLLYQAIPELLSYSSVLPGAQGDDLNLPWFANVPAYSDFHQAMNTYAKGVTYGSVASRMWVAFEVFEAAMMKAGDNPTTQSVFDGVYSLPANDTVGGLAPPLNYVRDKPTPPVNCFFVFGIANGKFTLPNGTNDECLPESISSSPIAKAVNG
jgi:branched-chain amino acid transport system substrate-binding protein